VRTDDDLTRMLTDLAARADRDGPGERLSLVHQRARRTARRKVVAASAIAVVVVAGGAALLGTVRDTAAPAPSQPASSPTTSTGPTPSVGSTPTPGVLAPPDRTTPAFAACPSAAGAVVTVVADPDVPSPRCTTVTAGQRLRVVNDTAAHGSTPQVITVTIAGFAPRTVQPGASTTFDSPFGDYLATGKHVVHLTPLYGGDGGAVVWLR
jgi:hypothetical protein